jgi:hypothetical protein
VLLENTTLASRPDEQPGSQMVRRQAAEPTLRFTAPSTATAGTTTIPAATGRAWERMQCTREVNSRGSCRLEAAACSGASGGGSAGGGTGVSLALVTDRLARPGTSLFAPTCC